MNNDEIARIDSETANPLAIALAIEQELNDRFGHVTGVLVEGKAGLGSFYEGLCDKRPVDLDRLAAQLGVGQVRMRRKQGVFHPRRLVVLTALAHKYEPPPSLVVQFDNWGVKTTFPMRTV